MIASKKAGDSDTMTSFEMFSRGVRAWLSETADRVPENPLPGMSGYGWQSQNQNQSGMPGMAWTGEDRRGRKTAYRATVSGAPSVDEDMAFRMIQQLLQRQRSSGGF